MAMNNEPADAVSKPARDLDGHLSLASACRRLQKDGPMRAKRFHGFVDQLQLIRPEESAGGSFDGIIRDVMHVHALLLVEGTHEPLMLTGISAK